MSEQCPQLSLGTDLAQLHFRGSLWWGKGKARTEGENA